MTLKPGNIQIRCLVPTSCQLGEGPIWDSRGQCLYWVDILDNKIYRYRLTDNTTEFWMTPEHVGFVVLKRGGGLIAGFKSGLHDVQLNEDRTVSAVRIDRVDDNLDYIRFNDGSADPQGRIWACTMDMRSKAPLGKYYRYDTNLTRTVVDEGYVVANGPALSPDGRQLFTVETVGHANRPKAIYISQISGDGMPENKRLWIDWSQFDSYPDGLISDTEGNLWIGEWGGNVLRCYGPDGKLRSEIELPAWNITKPIFGGDQLDMLYVTSARAGTSETILAKYPNTGGIIEITGTGFRGLNSTYV